MAKHGMITRRMNLVPGQDTGSIAFIFPVTAYTQGLKVPA
jgi:hypothetical protein